MLKFRPKRILYRIILPFTLLFGITTVVSWMISAYFITHYLDQGLRHQMEQIVLTISKSSYILNPAILRQVKKVVNAEIVLFDQDGRILRSTFSEPGSEVRLKSIILADSNPPLLKKDMKFGGARYRIIVHPLVLPEHGHAFLSLWMPTHEEDRLKTRIIVGIGAIALFGILAMAVAGYLIARTITLPVEELVKVTGKVSGGDLNQRVHLDSKDEIGSLAGSFNHMIDQLKTFEEKLVASEKLATAGQMAAGMAHEIRNPLTSIKMLGQVLQGRIKDRPEDQKTLESLVKEINRLDRIVQEMINRASPGELQMEWDGINQQVEEVIGVANETLVSQEISLESHLSKKIPRVHMDREKMKQVLWNLILNAKDAMPKGGHLSVSTGILDNGFVEILVEDSGHGLAKGEDERLFQPFFTTKPEGVGLGLTISRKIVEKHGGKLTLGGRTEGGTRARVVLPIKAT